MTRTVIYDENGSELSFWINNKGSVWLQISDDDPMMAMGVQLEKSDAEQLIKELQKLVKEL